MFMIENWLSGSGEEDFQKSSKIFTMDLPLEKGLALPLNKLESPLLKKDDLYQVWNICRHCGSQEEDSNVKSLDNDNSQ